MLREIDNLPSNILGLKAEEKLTRDDYEKVLVPLLAQAHRRGQRVRFLYQFGPEFSGFTAGGIVDDFKVGFKYFRLFERCAVVSDSELISTAAKAVGAFLPIPVMTFKNDQMKNAVEWLSSADADSKMKFELRDNGVLIVRPQGALRREDFDKLASVVDPWIETHHKLSAVVISIQKFPGWENVGSFIHHIEFVKAHHRSVRKVALVVDGVLPEIMSKVAGHFVEAEIKQFPFADEEDAVKWASFNK